ncbi:MAG TPA: hypothetical protein VF247_07285 [Candidatus Krumholzibacteria bacterium]
MRSRSASAAVVLAALIIGLSVCAQAQQTQPATTQAAMRGIFVTLSKVYDYSFDATAFADPKNRSEILGTLTALARNAEELNAHGGGLDPSFDLARRSISRDATEALASYRDQNFIGSRFILNRITDNCVTCHTKLPAERQFGPGKAFLDSIDMEKLPLTVRANLQIAARQFADAQKTYEDVLADPKMTADDLAAFDVFPNYLRVSVGSMNDTKRPAATLEKFAKRADMPPALKADVAVWIQSLQTLKLDAAKGGELVTARAMVADARAKTAALSDRSRLVDFVGAISLVHRYLREGSRSDMEKAEAYYLLGVSESFVSRSDWISETDYLLEKAIRTAPKSDTAKQSLAFLEEYHRSGYVVPARAVPADMQINMDELRKLVQK